MAAKGITLPIVFVSDDKGIKAAERAIKGFESRLGGLEKLLRVGVAGAAVVAGAAIAGVGFAITKGFGRLQDIEEATFKLTGLGNSAEVVEEVMKNALAAVKGTAFGLGEAGTIAASAVAAGVKPGKELTRFLTLTADAAAIAGTSLEEMGGTLNKVVTIGKAQNDTLRVLAEKGIPIYATLADQLGVTAAEIFSMATEGEISVEMLATALETTLGGAAKKMGDSTAGAFANMNAAIARSGANLIKNIFPQFGNFFRQMIEVMEPVEAIATRVGEALGAKLNPVFDGLIASLPKIIPFLEGLDSVFANLTTRFMIVKGAVQPILDAFVELQSRLPDLRTIFDSIVGSVQKLATQGLGVLLVVGTQVATQLLPALVDAFILIAPPIIALISALGDAFLPIIIELAEIVIPILVGILNVLTPIISFLATVLENTGTSVAILVVAIFGAIKAFQLFQVLLVITKGLQLGLAAATLGAVGATYAQTTAQKIGLVTGNLLNGTYLMQAGALLTNTVHLVASRVALIASTVATNIAAVAVRIFNAALMANPIGLIVGLLAILTSALIFFLTNTETGKQVVQDVFAFFQKTFKDVGETFQFIFGVIMPAVGASFMAALKQLGENIVAFGEGFVKVLMVVGDFFKDIINGYIGIWESFINFFLNGLNLIIRGLNRLQVRLPATPFSGPLTIGVNIAEIPKVTLPRLADGGIVSARPGGILANIGEGRFDEAVIPLDGRNRMGSTFNITVNAGMGTDGARVGEQIVNLIRRYERSSGPVFARA